MTAVPRVVADVAVVSAPDHAVVLNLPRLEEQQSPYVFEGAAFAIWSLIDGSRTEAQIVDVLTEATGAPREVVARDTSTFLSQLRGLGLIVSHESSPGESPTVK